MTTTTRTVRITWVESDTANWNPAGPADETIETADTLDEIREAALNFAAEGGYDLDQWDCRVEEIVAD